MNDCVIFERKSKSENLMKGIIHNVFCVIQLKFTCRCRSFDVVTQIYSVSARIFFRGYT